MKCFFPAGLVRIEFFLRYWIVLPEIQHSGLLLGLDSSNIPKSAKSLIRHYGIRLLGLCLRNRVGHVLVLPYLR